MAQQSRCFRGPQQDQGGLRRLPASLKRALEVSQRLGTEVVPYSCRAPPCETDPERVRSPVQKRTLLDRDFHQTLCSLQNPPWIPWRALKSSPVSRAPRWVVSREWAPERVRQLRFSQSLLPHSDLKRSIIPWGAFGVVGLNCFFWTHSQPRLQRGPSVPGRREPRWGGLPDSTLGGTAEPR